MQQSEAGIEFKNDLLPGEEIVWIDKPKSGLRFSNRDLWLIPLALFGNLFLFYILLNKEALAYGFIIDWVLVPLAGAFLYLLVGRFAGDVLFMRKNTFYAITNKRVMLKSGFFTKQLSSIDLGSVSRITFWKNSRGGGFIKIYSNTFEKISTPNDPLSKWGRYLRFQYLDNVMIPYELLETQRMRIKNEIGTNSEKT